MIQNVLHLIELKNSRGRRKPVTATISIDLNYKASGLAAFMLLPGRGQSPVERDRTKASLTKL